MWWIIVLLTGVGVVSPFAVAGFLNWLDRKGDS